MNRISRELVENLETQVHIWFCEPEAITDSVTLARYRSVLSEKEIQQCQRFRFEKDSHSYLVSHALTRYVLSRYLDKPAADIQFEYEEKGKPVLNRQPDETALEFNITHTDGLCACVVALNRACGVDVENINTERHHEKVAERMFADEEVTVLMNSDNLRKRFCYYWTLREACIKALGTGLVGNSKDYYFDIDKVTMTAAIRYRESNKQQWQFNLFEPDVDHVLSVAVVTEKPLTIQINKLVP